MTELTALMRKLDYEFNDISLLKLALTHRSKGSKNYERLEFLGDSILGFVIAESLYEKYPKESEGKLSRMRSSLVRQETLADVAKNLKLSDYLILGEGELKSGGFNRASILSDVVESLIGAIYLDADFSQANKFIQRYFKDKLTGLSVDGNYKDAKSQLQEFMQKMGLDLPQYQIIETSGEQHNQEFTVECSLPSRDETAIASANSRRMAEQKSAAIVLEKLQAEASR